jgi:hypothetical protein
MPFLGKNSSAELRKLLPQSMRIVLIRDHKMPGVSSKMLGSRTAQQNSLQSLERTHDFEPSDLVPRTTADVLRRTFLLPDGSSVDRQVRQGGPGSSERWSVRHETLGNWPDVPVGTRWERRWEGRSDRATCAGAGRGSKGNARSSARPSRGAAPAIGLEAAV